MADTPPLREQAERDERARRLHEIRYRWNVQRDVAPEDFEWLLDAALAAESREPAGWRPIATAPKDGTRFIAWGPNDGFLFTAHWSGGMWTTEYEQWRGPMTHWQPFPPPPQEPR